MSHFKNLIIIENSSWAASNRNGENMFYNHDLNWYYTRIYKTKVFSFKKTLAYLSILFTLYCISDGHILEK